MPHSRLHPISLQGIASRGRYSQKLRLPVFGTARYRKRCVMQGRSDAVNPATVAVGLGARLKNAEDSVLQEGLRRPHQLALQREGNGFVEYIQVLIDCAQLLHLRVPTDPVGRGQTPK